MIVRLTLEALPPIYGIRSAEWAQNGKPWPDGKVAMANDKPEWQPLYLGGYLTEEDRAEAVERNGWKVAP